MTIINKSEFEVLSAILLQTEESTQIELPSLNSSEYLNIQLQNFKFGFSKQSLLEKLLH